MINLPCKGKDYKYLCNIINLPCKGEDYKYLCNITNLPCEGGGLQISTTKKIPLPLRVGGLQISTKKIPTCKHEGCPSIHAPVHSPYLSDNTPFHPTSMAHGSVWGVLSWVAPRQSLRSSPSLLLPNSTPRAVAHGGVLGCCRGGRGRHPHRPLFVGRGHGHHPRRPSFVGCGHGRRPHRPSFVGCGRCGRPRHPLVMVMVLVSAVRGPLPSSSRRIAPHVPISSSGPPLPCVSLSHPVVLVLPPSPSPLPLSFPHSHPIFTP